MPYSALPLRLVVSIAVIHDPMNAKLGRMFEPFIFGHRIRVVIFFQQIDGFLCETVADASGETVVIHLYCLNASGYGKPDSYIKGNEKQDRVGFC